jgi:hypothetical protein
MATATEPREQKKLTPAEREAKVEDIRERNRDMYQSHGEDIATGALLRFTPQVFAEQKFLLEEYDRLKAQLKKLKAPLTDE